mmetsp:Transcript_9779/g.20578  ORF Transcript_9779/g.20578 Transcript_9779/m.20578 type:complete len:241 (-) Transcript_9779:553-1275(-)
MLPLAEFNMPRVRRLKHNKCFSAIHFFFLSFFSAVFNALKDPFGLNSPQCATPARLRNFLRSAWLAGEEQVLDDVLVRMVTAWCFLRSQLAELLRQFRIGIATRSFLASSPRVSCPRGVLAAARAPTQPTPHGNPPCRSRAQNRRIQTFSSATSCQSHSRPFPTANRPKTSSSSSRATSRAPLTSISCGVRLQHLPTVATSADDFDSGVLRYLRFSPSPMLQSSAGKRTQPLPYYYYYNY